MDLEPRRSGGTSYAAKLELLALLRQGASVTVIDPGGEYPQLDSRDAE